MDYSSSKATKILTSETGPILYSQSSIQATNAIPQCDIAVLIPCYNEGLTIGNVVRSFAAVLPHTRIYVYDNNSKDNTAKAAAEAGAIVREEILQGKGNVVRRMFRDIEADLYVLVDGDDTYDPNIVIEMLNIALIGPFDLVNGIRISEQGEPAYRLGHQLGNYILTGIVKFIFGNRIEDMLSGYKVFSRRFVKSFPTLSRGFEIETELTVHALELQMPIAHVKGLYRGRPAGSSSKLNTLRDGRKIGLYILKLLCLERPIMFFNFISGVLLISSIGLATPYILSYVNAGAVPSILPLTIIITCLLLAAFFSFITGLVLNSVTRGRRETKMMHYLHIPYTPAANRGFSYASQWVTTKERVFKSQKKKNINS
jgi:glycosyltransferase involved in cell wall biosynthesis